MKIDYREMNRSQRLVIIDQLLREQGRVPIADLYRMFGIQERTLYRDVSDLNMIGRRVSFGGPSNRRFIRLKTGSK